jgi:flagellar protein FliJ
MKTFKFSLQQVLDIKETLEEIAEVEMAKAMRKLESSRRDLNKLQKYMDTRVREAEKLNGVTTDGHELYFHFSHLDWLQKKTQKQLQEVLRMEENVKKVRNHLLELLKDVKIMENLKDKESYKWLKDKNHKEQVELDEISRQIYQNNRKIKQEILELES